MDRTKREVQQENPSAWYMLKYPVRLRWGCLLQFPASLKPDIEAAKAPASAKNANRLHIKRVMIRLLPSKVNTELPRLNYEIMSDVFKGNSKIIR